MMYPCNFQLSQSTNFSMSNLSQPLVSPMPIAVPVPQPIAVPIDRPCAVPVPQPIAVPVDRPYPVPVPVSTYASQPVVVHDEISIPRYSSSYRYIDDCIDDCLDEPIIIRRCRRRRRRRRRCSSPSPNRTPVPIIIPIAIQTAPVSQTSTVPFQVTRYVQDVYLPPKVYTEQVPIGITINYPTIKQPIVSQTQLDAQLYQPNVIIIN